jgi:Zn-dependent peptidase ImmA (M78 family)/transcriptional regulator with XRE-family HTH domain
MFNKNLKYYRLKKSLSKKELAERVNVSSMAITNYESGTRKPHMEIMKLLAKELGVKVSDFLAVRNENLVFCHGEFRKNTTLNTAKQEYVREEVEEYLSRFMTVVEILGGDVLPEAPPIHVVELSDDEEKNAAALRAHLSLASDGPIDNLIGTLENKGILVMSIDIGNSKFSGMNGLVNGRPYIVINPAMTTERNRSTLIHELAHLMFLWPKDMKDKDVEKAATAIAGAFLFPKNDVIRELGLRRNSIANDMILTAVEYGISMMLLVTRAKLCNVVLERVANDFYIQASKHGWRTSEPSRIEPETPSLFRQLVYRAVSENDVSIQRGAELLRIPYDEVASHCCAIKEA